jgi:hypothetical protein
MATKEEKKRQKRRVVSSFGTTNSVEKQLT